MTRDRLKNLVGYDHDGERVDGTTLTDIDGEVSIVIDKGDANLTRTKGHKRRMSDRENANTWTSKKSKVSFPMRMLALLTVHSL